MVNRIIESSDLSKVNFCDLYRAWEQQGKELDERVKTDMQRHMAREIWKIDAAKIREALQVQAKAKRQKINAESTDRAEEKEETAPEQLETRRATNPRRTRTVACGMAAKTWSTIASFTWARVSPTRRATVTSQM